MCQSLLFLFFPQSRLLQKSLKNGRKWRKIQQRINCRYSDRTDVIWKNDRRIWINEMKWITFRIDTFPNRARLGTAYAVEKKSSSNFCSLHQYFGFRSILLAKFGSNVLFTIYAGRFSCRKMPRNRFVSLFVLRIKL